MIFVHLKSEKKNMLISTSCLCCTKQCYVADCGKERHFSIFVRMKVGCMLYQIFRIQAAVLFKCSAFRQNLHTTRREKIERDYRERGRRRREREERMSVKCISGEKGESNISNKWRAQKRGSMQGLA